MSSPAPQPLPDAPQPEEVPWWLKYAGRGMGTFGGIGEYYVKQDDATMTEKQNSTSHQRYNMTTISMMCLLFIIFLVC